MNRARRRSSRRTIERCGMTRLPNDAVRASAVGAAKNRADVLRILDAVEDDEPGRPDGAGDELLERVRGDRLNFAGDTLMHPAVCELVERAPIDGVDGNAQLHGARDERIDARPAATYVNEARDPSRGQGFGDGVDAVNQ